VKATPLAALALATLLLACSSDERLPGDPVAHHVLDSGSLRHLAIAGNGRFAQPALVNDCLAPRP
jgi:hypothetical protein